MNHFLRNPVNKKTCRKKTRPSKVVAKSRMSIKSFWLHSLQCI